VGKAKHISEHEFAEAARRRQAVRRYLFTSERAANAVGLTAARADLLAVVRGFGTDEAPSASEVAIALAVTLPSLQELLDRSIADGLVTKTPDPNDGRRQLIRVTPRGEDKLRQLLSLHRTELAAASRLLLEALSTTGRDGQVARARRTAGRA